MDNEKFDTKEMPALNGRFGASGAVTPQTILYKFARYFTPQERQWKSRLREAAGTLGVSGGNVPS